MVRFESDPLAMLRTGGLDGLFRVAESMHSQLTQPTPSASGNTGSKTAQPRARLTVEDDTAKLVMLIPGFGAEHLDISVERTSVSIAGEREDGPAGSRFSRTFELPFPVDAAAARAAVEHGVLSLELPRREADKPQRVQILGSVPKDAEVEAAKAPVDEPMESPDAD